jgi:hypothetical protein
VDARDLYGLPLERFTAERNTLAKELRRSGRRDEAERVAKLRKPSVAAWAVNQLARTQRRELEALFNAGDALQRAQADLLAKRGDAHALRAAVDAEREAVDELAARARGLLSSDGHELTPARLEQVSETLHAAALETDARSRIAEGCLERELRHVGLGALTPGEGIRAPKGRAAADNRAQLHAARKDEAAARRRHDQALRKLEAAARRRRDQALRKLGAAEQRRERAAGQLEAAERDVAEARRAADAAAREHAKAEQELSALS